MAVAGVRLFCARASAYHANTRLAFCSSSLAVSSNCISSKVRCGSCCQQTKKATNGGGSIHASRKLQPRHAKHPVNSSYATILTPATKDSKQISLSNFISSVRNNEKIF
jgi:hypothetical protein